MTVLPAWNLPAQRLDCRNMGIGRAIVLAYITKGFNVACKPFKSFPRRGSASQLTQESQENREYGHQSGQILELCGDMNKPETSTNLIEKGVSQWDNFATLLFSLLMRVCSSQRSF